MDEELQCLICKHRLVNPILLSCGHALCLTCSVHEQKHINSFSNGNSHSITNSYFSNGSSIFDNLSPCDNVSDIDKHSDFSETDSGVVCPFPSRPNSNSSCATTENISTTLLSTTRYTLTCPACGKIYYLNENGAYNFPLYLAMQNIINEVTKEVDVLKCHLCEPDLLNDATVFCEQCKVLYCDGCLDVCHPKKGPLAKHVMLDPKSIHSYHKGDVKKIETYCGDHEKDHSLYCNNCRVTLCDSCLPTSVHSIHDVSNLIIACKQQKAELSQCLQQLSSRARSTNGNLSDLKLLTESINENRVDLEGVVIAQCDDLISRILEKKLQLVDYIRRCADDKNSQLGDYVLDCGRKLHQVTGFLQYCFEVLKEQDSHAFLQASGRLLNRIEDIKGNWRDNLNVCSPVSAQFNLKLDLEPVARAIEELNFIQNKAPAAPVIVPENCSAENNSVTVAWKMCCSSYVEGFVLELDDGRGGQFKEVYCGEENICTVDGLHFNSIYNARVKAYNSSGEGPHSEIIGLQTTDVAWFVFDRNVPSEMCLSGDGRRVSCSGYEHRVALGNVGFSRGIHYWQYYIERYDADADPSFGVANKDIATNVMLGKDSKGWAMYIDGKRSWFMHAGKHHGRTNGGIAAGDTVGVLLDLVQQQLTFYVNDQQQGPVAFNGLYGRVFYPAVSLNRGISVILRSALRPPTQSSDSDD